MPAALALALGAACGGGSGNGGGDAGAGPVAHLVVLDPPSQSIGLSYGESVTLRVRYEYEDGSLVGGATVSFAILESATADPGGSTLSATSATTDASGIAQVDLTAGASRATFRVQAQADGATPAYFYVSVSQDGFAELAVTPEHQGARDPASFDHVELRLFMASNLQCADLDIDALPDSVFPPLATDGFDGTIADFRNISAGGAYTLVTWAEVPGSDVRLAAGCIDLPSDVILPTTISLTAQVTDRPAHLPAAVALRSTIDLTPLADELQQSGIDAPWRTLACPVGPGQLMLDCTLDALAPDGTLDCVVNSTDALVASVEAQRGTPGPGGCRPMIANANASLDSELAAAIAQGGFPSGAALTAMLDARTSTLGQLELVSELRFLGPGVAGHRLDGATIKVAGNDYAVSLGQTKRPVVDQQPVAITIDADQQMTIGDHGFTLRIGSLLRAGFRDQGLAIAGLADRETDLGTALAESAYDGSSSTYGCDAVSAILCGRIGQSQSCAVNACNAAAAHLDGALSAWWQHLDGAGLDCTMSGTATVHDDNNDLEVDAVGDSTAPGSWTVTMMTAGGTGMATTGTFASDSVVAGP